MPVPTERFKLQMKDSFICFKNRKSKRKEKNLRTNAHRQLHPETTTTPTDTTSNSVQHGTKLQHRTHQSFITDCLAWISSLLRSKLMKNWIWASINRRGGWGSTEKRYFALFGNIQIMTSPVNCWTSLNVQTMIWKSVIFLSWCPSYHPVLLSTGIWLLVWSLRDHVKSLRCVPIWWYQFPAHFAVIPAALELISTGRWNIDDWSLEFWTPESTFLLWRNLWKINPLAT